MNLSQEKWNEIIETLRNAQSVAALTGAGVSAESGVPTFRDPEGLWAQMNPEELASMEGFLKNPKRVWQWYQYRKKLVQETTPNPAHDTLVEFENYFPNWTLITQNVDNLHQRAGNKKVLELHGNMERSYCLGCGKFEEPNEHSNENEHEIPYCAHCGGKMRPDVVWFGEALPESTLMKSLEASKTADVFLSIGTSAQVFPAAAMPWEALKADAYVIECNLNPTELSENAHAYLEGKVGETLPMLLKALISS